MRLISQAWLRKFGETPSDEDSAGPQRAWQTHVSHQSVAWPAWGDVKTDFGTASLVGNGVVFNGCPNKYRLVTRILDPSRQVFVLNRSLS